MKYDDPAAMVTTAQLPVDMDRVREILADVRERGNTAVKEYTSRFDNVDCDIYKIGREQFQDGYSHLDDKTKAALETSADNLRTFCSAQLEQLKDFEIEIRPGVFTGQTVKPLERVGVYVPGGNFPLISSLLMGAIPARSAGVKEIVVCTPPGKDGSIAPAMLAAAHIAGIDELYAIGGVQAVAALAYGTESIRPVDKIVGPGNRYVTAAKKEVYGDVGIDFVAGPSEVMIIADDSAQPSWIAADLLAQAEHDTHAVPVLVTPFPDLAKRVQKALDAQWDRLEYENRLIAAESLKKNGKIILVDTMDQALAFANRMAPEHLELHVNAAETYTDRLHNYGTLFIGAYAAEVLGDYSSGLNHTLPTDRAARYSGGLSVRDFVKVPTTLRVTKRGITAIGDTAFRLARLEGLNAHAAAVKLRMTPLNIG